MAVIVIALGFFTTVYRSPIQMPVESIEIVTGNPNLLRQINQIDHENLPCCRTEAR